MSSSKLWCLKKPYLEVSENEHFHLKYTSLPMVSLLYMSPSHLPHYYFILSIMIHDNLLQTIWHIIHSPRRLHFNQCGNHQCKQRHTCTRLTPFITNSVFSSFIYIFMISSTCYVGYTLSTISTGIKTGQSNNRNKFIEMGPIQ